jgi:prevent-host-death family protein
MPRIESISSLRDQTREISEFCHKEGEPVFLTTNGKGDLVVLSVERFAQMQAELDLLSKLGAAQAEEARGEKGIGHAALMKKLQGRLNARPR